ncbi:helix-turn-helix domain-containing protein [Mycolicibacterium vinylchloridicum]|uniref:MarR family transcriptional regulator n=1 Tax=Mycolicibacterium vinylchloridicum TaxID=2736928 RepID=UPI00103DE7B3|nr:MarR family transcriptional regulator [Mycolicibacterium vinylchloridicum]
MPSSTATDPDRVVSETTLQARVLNALARQSSPSTTTELRAALDRTGCQPVVIERVYAALVALERKGLVHRGTNAMGTRPVWELGSPPPAIDTARSHTMHCTVRSPAPPHAAAALTAPSLEDRIARIETPAQARDLAEVILDPWEAGAWQRWKPVASAPLAGWLHTARRADVSSRVDWIIRALAHRERWARAARDITQDEQLQESLRSVSRLDDRQFADVGWMLVLAVFPWSSCTGATVPTPTAGEW